MWMISEKRWKFNFDENRFALKRVFCCCYSLGMHINCAFVKHSYKTGSIGVMCLQLTKMLSVLKPRCVALRSKTFWDH